MLQVNSCDLKTAIIINNQTCRGDAGEDQNYLITLIILQ